MLKINRTSKVSPSRIHLPIIESIVFLVFIYCGQDSGWLIFPVQSTELCSNCSDIASRLAEDHWADWGICKRQKQQSESSKQPSGAAQHIAAITPPGVSKRIPALLTVGVLSLLSVEWWNLHNLVDLLRMNSVWCSGEQGQKS